MHYSHKKIIIKTINIGRRQKTSAEVNIYRFIYSTCSCYYNQENIQVRTHKIVLIIMPGVWVSFGHNLDTLISIFLCIIQWDKKELNTQVTPNVYFWTPNSEILATAMPAAGPRLLPPPPPTHII